MVLCLAASQSHSLLSSYPWVRVGVCRFKQNLVLVQFFHGQIDQDNGRAKREPVNVARRLAAGAGRKLRHLRKSCTSPSVKAGRWRSRWFACQVQVKPCPIWTQWTKPMGVLPRPEPISRTLYLVGIHHPERKDGSQQCPSIGKQASWAWSSSQTCLGDRGSLWALYPPWPGTCRLLTFFCPCR